MLYAYDFLQILLLTTCPESPAWLEQVGRRDASDDACIRLWGPHALLPDPDYEADAGRLMRVLGSAVCMVCQSATAVHLV